MIERSVLGPVYRPVSVHFSPPLCPGCSSKCPSTVRGLSTWSLCPSCWVSTCPSSWAVGGITTWRFHRLALSPSLLALTFSDRYSHCLVQAVRRDFRVLWKVWGDDTFVLRVGVLRVHYHDSVVESVHCHSVARPLRRVRQLSYPRTGQLPLFCVTASCTWRHCIRPAFGMSHFSFIVFGFGVVTCFCLFVRIRSLNTQVNLNSCKHH